jgi:hypothetical protein
MIFDLDQTDGEWFPFFTSTIDARTGDVNYDDPMSDAMVQIRSMQPFFEEQFAKKKKNIEHVLNPKTRQMERIAFYPELSTAEIKQEQEDAWDYAITGLKNFRDKQGNIIECTRENKIKLMKVPVFDRFIAKCFQTMANTSAMAKEESEKN